jgi:hypothetical protein
MPRTRRRVPAAAAAALIATGVLACTGPRIASHQYQPGEMAVSRQQLRLELRAATYDERQLTVLASLGNVGADRIVVEKAGILLAYDDLEFPVADDPQGPALADIELAPGETRDLALRFDTGSRIVADATLMLRAIRRGDTWQDVLQVPIAAAPPLPQDEE